MNKIIQLLSICVILAGCTTISKSSMNSDNQNMSVAFGRVIIKIFDEDRSNDCEIEIKTPNKKVKYSLDKTGEVFIQADTGIVFLTKLECNNGWDKYSYSFIEKKPVFVIINASSLTYFGTVTINWDVKRKFNPVALIPVLGTSPTYGEGPMNAVSEDNLEADLNGFVKQYPEIAKRPIDKAVLKFIAL